MARYPFQQNFKISDETSKRLKILSLIYKEPITKVCEKVIQYYWEQTDKEKIIKTGKKLKSE